MAHSLATHKQPHTVLVVDDHPLFRKGVHSILQGSPDFVVCGDAGDGKEALARMRADHPSVIILDISLPGYNGLELIKMMRAERPDVPIVILTVHSETVYAVRALKAGARGYILKGEPGQEIIAALHRVMRGELHLSAKIQHQILQQAAQALDASQEQLVDRLTRREREIFELIGEKLTPTQIAERLGLSIKTIDTHRLHIKEKLFCESIAEIAKFATIWRLSSKGEPA